MFYSREMSSKVRDTLEAEGKDSSLGAVVGIVSTQVSGCNFSVFVCLPLLFSYASFANVHVNHPTYFISSVEGIV